MRGQDDNDLLVAGTLPNDPADGCERMSPGPDGRGAREGERGPALDRVASQLGCLPPGVPESAAMPAKWRFEGGRLLTAVMRPGEGGKRQQLWEVCARRPLLPVSVVETDAGEHIELAYKACSDERWRTTTVPAEIVSDARQIVGLAAEGVAVTSNDARGLVRFIADYVAVNVLPRAHGRTACGWVDEHTFVLGSRVVGETSMVLVPDPADEIGRGVVRAIGCGGEEALHLEILREAIRCSPALALALATSVAAPYLEPCALPTYGLAIHGPGGCGKTSVLRVVMSPWGATGQPAAPTAGGVVRVAQGTPKSLLDGARVTNGLPFAASDLTADVLGGQGARGQLAAVLQTIVNGKGMPIKRRSGFGNRTGGTWESTILVEGELAVGELAEREGLHRRYIELGPPLIARGDGTDLGRLAARAAAHYGYSGLRIVEDLVKRCPEDRTRLRDEHARLADQLRAEQSITDQPYLSWARHIATALTAAADVDRVLGLGVGAEWDAQIRACFTDVLARESASDVGASQLDRARRFIRDLVSRMRGRLLDKKGEYPPEWLRESSHGSPLPPPTYVDWVGRLEGCDFESVTRVALRASLVRDELTKAGHAFTVWIQQLADSGTIVRPQTRAGERGEIATTRRLRGVRTRCYIVDLAAGDDAAAAAEEGCA